MIYNNRNYPHPVLGNADDFGSDSLSIDLKISSNGTSIEITPIFVLNCDALNKLISDGSATYLSHVYCRGTLYREVFKTQKSLSDSLIIPSHRLNGEVEIDFFICANKNIENYKSKDFNPEYGDVSFEVERGDIVAYAGKGKFHANKLPEELKSISALMNIDCSNKNKEPMFLEYSGQKITIMLSIEDYTNYKLLKNNAQYFGVVLSSIVLPALIEALYYLDEEESDEYSSNAWYKALKEFKDNSKHPDPLRIGQKILDNPINNCLEHLTIDEVYE